MKNFFISIGLLSLLFAEPASPSGELLAVVTEEQSAFEEGDCDKVESMIAEDVTFYANSRKMSRAPILSSVSAKAS